MAKSNEGSTLSNCIDFNQTIALLIIITIVSMISMLVLPPHINGIVSPIAQFLMVLISVWFAAGFYVSCANNIQTVFTNSE